MREEKQEIWFIPKVNLVVIVESRGRDYVAIYWDESSFTKHGDIASIKSREFFESIAEKVGEL